MALSVATLPTSPMSHDVEPETESGEKVEQKKGRLHSLFARLKREQKPSPDPKDEKNQKEQKDQRPESPPPTPSKPGLTRRLSRKLNVGIPRSTTFKRQLEEQRKNLETVEPTTKERKDGSRVRQRAVSAQPHLQRTAKRRVSAPEVGSDLRDYQSIPNRISLNRWNDLDMQEEELPPPTPPPPQPPPEDSAAEDAEGLSETTYDNAIDEEVREELEKKWILNLSMHFRDRTPREKFFLTYAQTSQKWRRVTISCDYQEVPPESLEADLKELSSQRDKSARIYESIRMSLGEIQFYETVTNLKLETRDDRLHVHVTEDLNEIIPYPSVKATEHLDNVPRIREEEIHFVEHMSGFVYKVEVHGNTWVKKEIPGPDSVEEFLYEVNALSKLVGAKHVIQLKGIVVSDDMQMVKGLLIAYAERNALVDIIYDNQEKLLWPRRERWARQIVQGLSEIHEAGFVQGDFTLSNIVIDGNDDVKIIDINRRGCPVGWEPPEIESLIRNGQRISMFIGVKSDLFQLGMVLWGLAMENDEPEREPRPLSWSNDEQEIPDYYRALTDNCLSKNPSERSSATDMVKMFPDPPSQNLFPEMEHSLSRNSSLVSLGNSYNYPPELSTEDIQGVDAAATQDISGFGQETGGFGNGSDTVGLELGYRRADLQALVRSSPGHPQNRYPLRSRDVSNDQHLPSNALKPRSDEEPLQGRSLPYNHMSNSPFTNTIPDTPHLTPRGRQALASPSPLPLSTHSSPPRTSSQEDPQIIAVSPTGSRAWKNIGMGQPYLIDRDVLDPDDEGDSDRALSSAKAARGASEMRGIGDWHGEDRARYFDHMDSGLADMDLGNGELDILGTAGAGELPGVATLDFGAEAGSGAGSTVPATARNSELEGKMKGKEKDKEESGTNGGQESQPENIGEAASESIIADQPEKKAEPNAEVNAGLQSQEAGESRLENLAGSQGEAAQPEAQEMAKAQPNSKAEAQKGVDAKAQAEGQACSKLDEETKSQVEAKRESTGEAKGEAKEEPKGESDTEGKTEPQPRTEADDEPDEKTNSKREKGAQAQPEVKLEAKADTDADIEATTKGRGITDDLSAPPPPPSSST